MGEYVPIVLVSVVGVVMGLVLPLAGAILSRTFRSHNPDSAKLSAYECGFDAFEDARTKFDVRYYLVAILFIIFDLEISFLFTWAVSLKNIEIVQRENLADNAAKMEAYIKGRLNEFADHPYVGEIRGKVLLLGIELVSDKEKKTPLEMAQANAILQNCLKQGVSIMRNGNTVPVLGNVLIMAPPLVLHENEADQIVDAIGNALKQALN